MYNLLQALFSTMRFEPQTKRKEICTQPIVDVVKLESLQRRQTIWTAIPNEIQFFRGMDRQGLHQSLFILRWIYREHRLYDLIRHQG